jgi:predicted ATPase
MTTLSKLSIRGFKSIAQAEIDFGARTILIGPNGAGKSNLLAGLRLLQMLASRSLGLLTRRAGGAAALFFRGPKVTASIELQVNFVQVQPGNNDKGYAYRAILGRSADNTFFFYQERCGYRSDPGCDFDWVDLGTGHLESKLGDDDRPTVKIVHDCLRRINFFHFHDTSVDSALRTPSRMEDAQYLRSDGSNLAAYVWALAESDKDEDRAAWRRILGLVRQVAPFVKDLTPATGGNGVVQLDWVDSQNDLYGPSHLSDGTLRAIALLVGLSQPSQRLSSFVSIDEPELGLHPAALEVLSGVIRSLDGRCQVLLSTQSTELLDFFEPGEVVVVERTPEGAMLETANQGSVFRRLDTKHLADWLAEYSLSALYKRNLLGGRP